jgi:hypothetical protein
VTGGSEDLPSLGATTRQTEDENEDDDEDDDEEDSGRTGVYPRTSVPSQ